jgi:hypothetical protein
MYGLELKTKQVLDEMREECDDIVSVLASFAAGPAGRMRVIPHVMKWRGRRFTLSTMGLYHPERRGAKQVHIFSFASGETAFRLELDPETLQWRLTEVFYGP